MEALFGDQPAGWNIAGAKTNVCSFKRDDFVNYRENHYVASATTVIVSGHFNEKEIISEVKKRFSDISSNAKADKLAVVETPWFGAPGALYARGAQYVIALNPAMELNGTTIRKFTIGATGQRSVAAVLQALNWLEAGWGGNEAGTVGGSPRSCSSLLSLNQVVEVFEQEVGMLELHSIQSSSKAAKCG